ncbi:transglycosylase SLT domain-containing protein [Actinomadura atramentaria]|uniref:aggregation-promoting factor C-terminal-like domain-containing protein n=1 Tax=Actinomadura atramentaria TaxID=1990 RepID=UPI00039EC926|nr:transglycosylase SLT domain-containing protein [Actinomadura atramentaria]
MPPRIKRIIGANDLERTAERLICAAATWDKAISRWEQLQSAANRLTGGGIGYTATRSPGWNAGSNYSANRANGGGARFSSTSYRTPQRPAPRRGPGAAGSGARGTSSGGGGGGGGGAFGGVAPSPSGGGGGGGGGFLSQMSGSLPLGAGKALSAMIGYGNQHMGEQLSIDAYVSSASMGMNGNAADGRDQLRRQIFGRNGQAIPSVGFNVNDTLRGEMIRRDIAGGPVGYGPGSTARSRAAYSDYMGISYAMPERSAEQVAKFQAQFASSAGTFTGLNLGLTPSGDGTSFGPGDIHAGIMNRIGQKTLSDKDTETLYSQGGTGYIQAIQSGFDPDMLKEYGLAMNKARRKGVSDSDFKETLKKAGEDDAEAQEKAAEWGMDKDRLRAVKRLNSTRQSRQADINEDFTSAVKGAAEVAAEFEKALSGIINLPIIKQIVGASGGGAVLDSVGKSGWAAGIGKLLMGGFGPSVGGLMGGLDLTPTMRSAKADIQSRIKGFPSVGCLRPGDPQDHGKGMACDFMTSRIGKRSTGSEEALGDRTAAYAIANASRLGIKYVIWKQRIFNISRGDKKWRRMGDRGSITQNHYDHVHISVVAGRPSDPNAPVVMPNGAGGGVALGDGGKEKKQDPSNPGDSHGTSTGSDAMGNKYGSVEEVESLAAALAGDGGTAGFASSDSNGSGTGRENGSGAASGQQSSGGTGGDAHAQCKLDDKKCLKELAKGLASKHGWGSGAQWEALDWLIQHESSWNPKAQNPSSGAYGLPQALPGNKMASVGKDWKTNPSTQLKWMLRYIKGRYKDPLGAQKFWRQHNWYRDGAYDVRADETAQVHKGESILPVRPAEKVREAIARQSLFSHGGDGDHADEVAIRFADNFVDTDLPGGDGTTGDQLRNTSIELRRLLDREHLYETIAGGV